MEAIQRIATDVSTNVETVIVGKHREVQLVLVALLCRGHVLIEDVPGVGKTMLAKAISRSIGCTFKRIQFTPDLLPSDVTGVSIFNQATAQFEFRPGPIVAQIVLADEINRATPKTQSALLEAMEESQITVDGDTHQLADPFIVLATENPIEYEGTYPLPEAQLDRFLLKILIDYPEQAEESEIVARWDAGFNSRHFERMEILPLGDPSALQHCRMEVRNMRTEASVQKYIVEIVRKTRNHGSILYGASPRASIALLLCSKALAAIRGRDFATPDDVRDVALPVLRHRLALRAEAELDGSSADIVITDIIKSVEVPR